MSTATQALTKSYPSFAQGFGIVGIMILLMLVCSPISFFVSHFAGQELATCLYYVMAMGLTFLIIYRIRRRITNESSLVFTLGNPRIVIPIIITTLALIYGVVAPLATLIPVPEFFKEVLRNLINLNGVLSFALMVIAAPILEELIFRGIMLDGMLKQYSPVKAIFMSSFLFGLVHLNPWQFIAAFIIGLFAGWVYHRTKSVLPCIIIHATANLAGFLTRELSQVNLAFDDTVLTMYGGLFNLMAIVAVSNGLIYGCLYYLQREFLKTATRPDPTE